MRSGRRGTRRKMIGQPRDVPLGVRVLQKAMESCCPRLYFNRELCYRTSVLFLTYIAYMCYHLSRKPISVVKAVLHHNNCSGGPTPPPHLDDAGINSCGDWVPFDGTDAAASRLLGELDSAFLFAYAGAMFVSGFVAERVNLRYFLAIGMLMSGIFTYLFGLAKSYNIHHLSYFVVVQACAGIFQTSGWPGVVTVVGNWFGKGKRGLIFGIWNSHTSIGNILGSLVAAAFVERDWALSFIIPGLIIGVAGFIIFMFLVVSPEDVGCAPPENDPKKLERSLQNKVANRNYSHANTSGSDASGSHEEQGTVVNPQYLSSPDSEIQRRVTERTHLLSGSDSLTESKAIGFIGALKIPGVIEFSLSLFFSKLVSYTFLYWLPSYVNAISTLGATYSADVSVLFDVGGIFGAIAAGAISDYSGMSATTCVGMLFFAIPMMFVYQHFGAVSLGINMFMLVVVGILVNGPYALITTAVSAELGTHSTLEGNSKALSTVTAIIDGTGSIGAAVGPLLAGFVSWNRIFTMLMVSDVLALVLLLRLAKNEISRNWRQNHHRSLRIE